MPRVDGFTPKQELFIVWYCKLLNATSAAERAGYAGDRASLGSQGAELLQNLAVRAEIDRRLKASIPSADETLSRIGAQAHADVTPYLDDELRLDVARLRADGLGHLVKGVRPGRQGPEVTLTDSQTAQKMLARYHRLLGDRLDVTVDATVDLGDGALAALTEQIHAAVQSASESDGDAE